MSGKRALDKNRPSGEHNLVEWAKPLLTKKRKISQVMDARIEGQYSLHEAMKVAHVAIQCLSIEPKYRPNIDEVVRSLEEQLQDSKERRVSESLNGEGTCNSNYPSSSASPLRT